MMNTDAPSADDFPEAAPQLCEAASSRPTWVTTFTGRQFSPMAPKADDIVIEDIAHQLSCMNRWLGATREPYSIAQHSVHVAELVPVEDALWALLHDASEAYLIDIPTHIKRLPQMGAYRAAEAHLQRIIYQRFGLSGPEPASVKTADNAMAVAEAQDLLPTIPEGWPEAIRNRTAPRAGFTVVAWSARHAERAFLERFNSPEIRLKKCKCGKFRRPGQRTCKDCHAAFMRDYRGSGFEEPA